MRSFAVRPLWKVAGVALAFGLAGPTGCRAQTNHYHPQTHAGLFPTPHRPPEGSVRMQQLRSMKTWTLAMTFYLMDTGDVYLEMKRAPAVKALLRRYVSKRDTALFTSGLYQPNSFLSHKSTAIVSDPARTVVFYEAKPDADGTRVVGFVDGHCGLILNQEWPRLKELSHLK